MEILTLYKAILESLNVLPDKDGLLSFHYQGQTFPAIVDDKRLTLPTPELLRAGDWTNLQPFHPLSENLLRGESAVLKKTKAIMNLRLSQVIMDLMKQFVTLGADTSKHAKLSPKAQELLSHIPEVDEKSEQAIDKIIDASDWEGPNRFMSLYLKRGGTLQGRKYHRLAVVSFPILEQFDNDDHTVFGVKLRKKDFVAFKSLLLYILPDAEDLETYSAASSSLVAPYFDALLHAFANVAEQLNKIVHTHRKQLDNADELQIPLAWLNEIDDLAKYRDLIPPLAGNDGDLIGGSEEAPAPPRPVPSIISGGPAPARVQQEVKKEEPKAPSPFNTDFNRQPAVPFTPAPAPAAPAAAPAAPSTVEIRHTKRGVDFNSVLEARQRTAFVPTPGFQGPVPPQALPAWAAPPMPANPQPSAGGYAGFHRGIPMSSPGYGYGHGAPTVGRGYAPTPSYGSGYGGGFSGWGGNQSV